MAMKSSVAMVTGRGKPLLELQGAAHCCTEPPAHTLFSSGGGGDFSLFPTSSCHVHTVLESGGGSGPELKMPEGPERLPPVYQVSLLRAPPPAPIICWSVCGSPSRGRCSGEPLLEERRSWTGCRTAAPAVPEEPSDAVVICQVRPKLVLWSSAVSRLQPSPNMPYTLLCFLKEQKKLNFFGGLVS